MFFTFSGSSETIDFKVERLDRLDRGEYLYWFPLFDFRFAFLVDPNSDYWRFADSGQIVASSNVTVFTLLISALVSDQIYCIDICNTAEVASLWRSFLCNPSADIWKSHGWDNGRSMLPLQSVNGTEYLWSGKVGDRAEESLYYVQQ